MELRPFTVAGDDNFAFADLWKRNDNDTVLCVLHAKREH